jgi:hypothetical protein
MGIPTKHGLITCNANPQLCQNLKIGMPENGLACLICKHNDIRPNKDPAHSIDNYTEEFKRAENAKTQLIQRVTETINTLDEKLLTPGCSVILKIDLDSPGISVDVINNLLQAYNHIGEAFKCLSVLSQSLVQPTPVANKVPPT